MALQALGRARRNVGACGRFRVRTCYDGFWGCLRWCYSGPAGVHPGGRCGEPLRLWGARLGWTQEEVAQVVGVTQGRIAQILLEMPELAKLIKSVLASGIPHLEVAERFNPHAPG